MPFNFNKRILRVMAFACIVMLLFSCKKAIEQQQRNIIIDAMTSGTWLVQQYKENTTDVTGEFLGYEFKFNKDYTVDGIKNSLPRGSGTWTTDISNYTISATFRTDANDTLKRLTDTWKITDSYLDSVAAKSTTSNNILHLVKTK